MPTPRPDLSRLSISQLAQVTGRDRRTITKALAGLKPRSMDGRAKLCEPRAALERIYLGQERLSVVDEQARLAKERADAQYLKNAEARGELVPARTMDTALIALASVIGGRLESLGSRLAPALAAEGTLARCQELVDEAVASALLELAQSADEAQKRSNGKDLSGATPAGG